jgi:phosphoglycerate kinase|tara:strand:+ start:2307 stop:3488 length:1182 start_codon:yes stop_codon:yes gene_type:complete
MSQLKSLKDLSKIKGKTVFLRVDFNVPISGGRVSDTTKIEKLKTNINSLLNEKCKVILASHLGRPQKKGRAGLSLKPVKKISEKILGHEINFLDINDETKNNVKNSKQKLIMLENLRFDSGEESNSKEYAKLLSSFADFYINEAFSCSHRSHASIDSITDFLDAYAGSTIIDEVDALEKVFLNSKKPVACLIGGSKISTKIDLIINLMPKMDFMIIGGAMANNFFKHEGFNIGKSLIEQNIETTIKSIYQESKRHECELILPIDVICSKKFDQAGENKKLSEVNDDDIILDIGIESTDKIDSILQKSNTVLWNGPFGLFEYDDFANGTNDISRSIAKYTKNNNLISVAGGGDTLAAIKKSNHQNDFTYISTAGGAFLEWLEGKILPGLKVLEK